MNIPTVDELKSLMTFGDVYKSKDRLYAFFEYIGDNEYRSIPNPLASTEDFENYKYYFIPQIIIEPGKYEDGTDCHVTVFMFISARNYNTAAEYYKLVNGKGEASTELMRPTLVLPHNYWETSVEKEE